MIECRGFNGLIGFGKFGCVLRRSCFFNWERLEVVGIVVIG